jgi:prolyl oligopeptidase PreP (S9A serine peptidase family)
MRLLSPSGGTGVGGRAVRLPADGSIGAIALGGRRRADTVYYVFQSVLIPPTVYAIDLETAASTPTSMTAPPFDPSAYTVRRIIDSTGAAPLYVVTSRAAATDSTRRPAWVDTAATVSHDDTLASPLEYAPAPIVWLELGGVYVVPAQPGAAAARAAADAVVRLRLARPDRVVIGAPRDADGLAALARVAWN